MKRFIVKHRKGLCILAGILFLPMLYLLSISWIHLQNTQHKAIYDDLRGAAQLNGLLVHHFKRPKQPDNLIRFYDDSKSFRTTYGLDAEYVGYLNTNKEIVIPAKFKFGDSAFYEGLAGVVTEDNRRAFIHPDGSIAFYVNADYVDSFFNGRAKVRKKSDPFEPFPWLLKGFIDQEGNTVADIEYYGAEDYIGELENEYTLVFITTTYTPIYESLMGGIDIDIAPFRILFPPSKAQFLDKNGNEVSRSEVIESIKRLEESATWFETQ